MWPAADVVFNINFFTKKQFISHNWLNLIIIAIKKKSNEKLMVIPFIYFTAWPAMMTFNWSYNIQFFFEKLITSCLVKKNR